MTELLHIEDGFRLIDGELINAMIDAIASSGVSTVSVVTANGVSGTVATPTTTPAITIVLGAITPSSVAAVGAVTGSNLSGSNTGDQTIMLTGDITGAGTGSFLTTLANGVVTLPKMADMATASILGRNTAGTGVPEVLSAFTTKSLLSLNLVENTALSTWAGSSNITTLGAVNATSVGATTPCQIQGFVPTNYQTGTSYTTVLGDSGKRVSLTNASAITLTVPPAASVAYVAESEMLLRQGGAGQATVTPGVGVTINSYTALTKLAGQYAYATLKLSTTANTWDLFGNLG